MTRQTAAGIFVSVAIMLALCAARPCRADEPAAQPKPKIAVIAIGNAVTERPAAFSLGISSAAAPGPPPCRS